MTELVTLKRLFSDENEERFFQIPDYQRGYSWENSHRQDLLGDLAEIAIHNTQHFTGTIVAARPTTETEPYSVVDGQQRLTTLVILMARLLKRAEARGIDPGLVDVETAWSRYVCKELAPGSFAWRLTLNGGQRDLFRRILTSGPDSLTNAGGESKADVNIKAAVVQFDERLRSVEDAELVEIYKSMTSKLGFLLYAPEDHREIGLMFEVINNRGKALSELEKVKNYLIYYANRNEMPELREHTNVAWGRIVNGLNRAGFTENQDEERFLRACWIVYNDPRKSESQRVYEGVKQRCSVLDHREGYKFLREFVNFLDQAVGTFERLYCASEGDENTREARILERIAYHPVRAAVVPLILAVMQKEQESAARAQALDLIEKLNFRYYVTGIAPRSDSRQGRLFSLAHSFYWGVDPESGEAIEGVDWLLDRLVRFVSNNAGRKSFVKNLTLDLDESGDYYGWQGLRFFLASYEEALRADRSQGPTYAAIMKSRDSEFHNDSFQKEHIVARKDTTATDDEEDILKRRLGNFVLLREGPNKSVKQKPIQEKIREGYSSQQTSELYQIQELDQFIEQAKSFVWDERGWQRRTTAFWYELYQKFLDLREEKLVNFALERWSVDQLPDEPARLNIDSFEAYNEIFAFR
jgi:hypothetical protein